MINWKIFVSDNSSDSEEMELVVSVPLVITMPDMPEQLENNLNINEDISEDALEPLPGPSSEMISPGFKWPSNQPHPLLIPDVLRNILEKLDMKDVETCRKVCTGWNYEACAVLKDDKLVALLEYDAVKFYLQKMENTPNFPHTQFELHVENFSERHPLMRSFWTKFGSHIKFLDLQESIIFIETLFQLLKDRLINLEKLALKTLPRRMGNRRNSHPPSTQSSSHQVIRQEGIDRNQENEFPNLKELTLCLCQTQEENVAKGVLKDLLRSMPSLEKLSISDIPSFVTNTGGNGRNRLGRLLLKVLMEPDVHLPYLKNIDFPLEVGNTELEVLARKRFQFNSLILLLNNGTKSSSLKDLLTSLSPYLKKLEMVFPENHFVDGITFPAYFLMKLPEASIHLKNVTDLTLKNFHGSLGFIKNLDMVKRLKINDADFDDYLPSNYGFFGSNERIYVCEHGLESFKTDSVMNLSVISNISGFFPLLRILHINGINDDGLGIIYRNLPYLIELEITDGKCSDQGISGVSTEVCNDMAETDTYTVEPEKYRTDLFIGSLQYLKTLKLSGDGVNDVSIAFGIVDCKNLKSLTLECSAVTDTGIIKIGDRMCQQLTFLNIAHCEKVTEAGKFYVKEKMKGIKIQLESTTIQQTGRTRMDNPNRQIGFPFRGRLCRQDRDSLIAVLDEEYDRLPLRDRMVIAMDRRRRNLHHRLMHRVGRGPILFGFHNHHEFDNEMFNPFDIARHERALDLMASDEEDNENQEMDADDEDEEIPQLANLEEHDQQQEHLNHQEEPQNLPDLEPEVELEEEFRFPENW